MAQGKVQLKTFTAADLHSMPHCQVAADVDPLAVLLAEREQVETARAEGLPAHAPGMPD